MAQVLDKRTADSRLFDIDCSRLLPAAVSISSVTGVSADGSTGLSFGSPSINASPITYTNEDGSSRTVPAGKVIQVRISGGTIPTGMTSRDCTVRAVFSTQVDPAVEATVLLRLIDKPNVY